MSNFIKKTIYILRMKNKRHAFTILFLSNFLYSCPFFVTPLLSAENIKLWSFEFNNCTASEALMQISRESGINIISNGYINKEILRKSYVNKGLDVILADLLRGENCALVWNYNESELDSIDLWTFENEGKRGGSFVSGINPKNSTIDKSIRGSVNRSAQENRNFNLTKRATQHSAITNNNLSKSNGISKNSNTKIQRRENKTSDQTLSRISKSAVRKSKIINSKIDKEGEQEERQPSSTEPEQPDKGLRIEPPPMPPGL